MARSTVVTGRGFSKTARGRRGMDHTMSYWPGLRLADNLHGYVDAKVAQSRGIGEHPWVHRLQSTYEENCLRVLVGTEDEQRESVSELLLVWSEIQQMDELVKQLEAAVEDIPAAVAVAGGAEQHLTEAAVLVRRNRERAVVVAVKAAELEAARERQSALLNRAATLTGAVFEEFAVAVAIGERFHSFYERRLHTYSRRLSRRRKELLQSHQLDRPTWMDLPCPWVPAALVMRLRLTGETVG